MSKVKLGVEWESINLGDAATFVNGYAFKPMDWSKKGLEIIRIQNLTKGSFQVNYFEGEIKERYKVRKGDLLISWSATLGIFEWKGKDAWLNQHLFKVIFDKKEFDKSFFKYLISSSLRKMEQEVHGATMKHITKKKFDAFKIPLPPLAEQQKIAEILDAADALRQKDQQLIDHYTALSQSLFLDMFGDPVINPMGWEKGASIEFSKCIVPGRDKPKSFTGNIPWVTTNDLNHLTFTKESKADIGLTEFEINNVKAKVIPNNSVILTCVGDLGVVSVNLIPVVVNQQLHTFQCDEENITPIFMMYALSYQTPYMNKMSSSTTVPYMNKSVCNAIPMIYPPIKLQTQFANHIAIIEKQKQQAQASLEQSNHLFNSLLQKAFTGELTA